MRGILALSAFDAAGGFVTTVTWMLFFKPAAHDLLEIFPGFAAGLLFTVIFSRFSAGNRPPGG